MVPEHLKQPLGVLRVEGPSGRMRNMLPLGEWCDQSARGQCFYTDYASPFDGRLHLAGQLWKVSLELGPPGPITRRVVANE